MKNKKEVEMMAGVAFTFIIIFAFKQILFKFPTFDQQMMQVASELNKSCPIMIDSETQLDNAVALPNNTIQYNYTLVNLKKEELNISELEKTLIPLTLNDLKTNSNLKTFRDKKVIMVFDYKDKVGVHLFKLTFKPEDYK